MTPTFKVTFWPLGLNFCQVFGCFHRKFQALVPRSRFFCQENLDQEKAPNDPFVLAQPELTISYLYILCGIPFRERERDN